MDFDILLYRVPLGKVDYPRPCVVIASPDFQLLNISTKQYANFNYFVIPHHHPDFATTGLTETSYVLGAPIISGEQKYVIKKLGKLTGELAREFSDWIG